MFTMRRPRVRSAYGMQIQEQFALFAANLVRWAAEWVRAQRVDAPPALARTLSAVKTLVRGVAHSRAWWVETEIGGGLVFDTHSPFAGKYHASRGFEHIKNSLSRWHPSGILNWGRGSGISQSKSY